MAADKASSGRIRNIGEGGCAVGLRPPAPRGAAREPSGTKRHKSTPWDFFCITLGRLMGYLCAVLGDLRDLAIPLGGRIRNIGEGVRLRLRHGTKRNREAPRGTERHKTPHKCELDFFCITLRRLIRIFVAFWGTCGISRFRDFHSRDH